MGRTATLAVLFAIAMSLAAAAQASAVEPITFAQVGPGSASEAPAALPATLPR